MPLAEATYGNEPMLSVVIPAKNAERTLQRTLDSVQNLETRHRLEVIVVDDGSSDATERIAREAGARVMPCNGRGVSAARNTGARAALGKYLLFADSDVVLPKETAELVLGRLEHEGYAAITGRLSPENPYPDFASQYKNLWMAYTYEVLPEEVALFYTSAAAVRRDLFLDLGGFDVRFARPSVEDTAFGQRLGDTGHRVAAEPRLAVLHLKSYRLSDVLRLDYMRARDLVRVFLARRDESMKKGNTSSVPTSFILSLPLAPLSFVFLLAGILLLSKLLLALALSSLVLFDSANRGFLSYLKRHKGWLFFLKAHLFLPLDALCAITGAAAGILRSGATPE